MALVASARTRPHYGGTLRVEIEGDPWNGPAGLARSLIYDGLTHLDPDGAVRPALAVEWQSENDSHRWQFRLRPGVLFHDGSPLTAAVVVQSLNLSCNTACPWAAVHPIGSTIVFTADSPMPNLPALLAGDQFLIALTVNGDGQPPAIPTGTGAFRFAGFTDGLMTLAANESSWQGRPFADQIQIRTHRAIRDQWLDLSLGRTDIVEIPPEEIRQAQQQHLTAVVSPPVQLLALQVSDSGPLSSSMLRGAIAQAVDRSALFNVIYQKQGEIAASLLPQELAGYAFLFPTARDLKKSSELRGGLTPPPLTFGFQAGGTTELAAQRLALNLREAGFEILLVPGSAASRTALTLRKLPLDAAPPSAAIEAVLRAAGESVAVPDTTPTALYRAERDFLDRNTLVPLLFLPRAYSIGPRIRDLQLTASGTPDLASVSLENAP
jgi:MarR-like DNA-binding transcriptional regulator SgrR of sgrS sRNA